MNWALPLGLVGAGITWGLLGIVKGDGFGWGFVLGSALVAGLAGFIIWCRRRMT
jgi:hypothetical protein